MSRPRASTPERPHQQAQGGLPAWAILVIVVCTVGAVTIAAHCFGIEAESLAEVFVAVTGLMGALGIGAAARRRRTRQHRNP